MSENRLTLDTEKQVFFYEQDHYYLSNFSAFMLQLAVKGSTVWFPTVEHAYHWRKFYEVDNGIAALVLNSTSAHDAFKAAERHKAKRRRDWDDIKIGVMKSYLVAKADQHEYVRRKLLETGDRELVENSWRDDFWGWGPDRTGQNMLGKLWMEVRAELRIARCPL